MPRGRASHGALVMACAPGSCGSAFVLTSGFRWAYPGRRHASDSMVWYLTAVGRPDENNFGLLVTACVERMSARVAHEVLWPLLRRLAVLPPPCHDASMGLSSHIAHVGCGSSLVMHTTRTMWFMGGGGALRRKSFCRLPFPSSGACA